MAVLITLPHGGPSNREDTPSSDIGALKLLPFLEEALEEMSIPYTTMVGKVNRSILDLNRLRAHSHPWIVGVREALLENDLHIDLHSYPKVDAPQRTSTGYDLQLWGRNTVVLFNVPEITDQDFLRSIERELEEVAIPSAAEQGGFENYISNLSSVLMDVPSLVMEINEGEVQNYPLVASALAVGILNYLGSLDEQLPLDDEPLPVEGA